VNGVFDAGDTKGFLSGLETIFAVKVRERDRDWIISEDSK
jgi:ferric-dicitrate binding protein FerR (iron transport regulator)